MAKLSVKNRRWLLGIHIIFAGLWIGAGLSMTLLLILSRPSGGDELYAMHAAVKLIDDYIIIGTAMGSLVTGLLFSIFTQWGFFKSYWVMLKLIITPIMIIIGIVWMGPWTNGLAALTKAERIQALQKPP